MSVSIVIKKRGRAVCVVDKEIEQAEVVFNGEDSRISVRMSPEGDLLVRVVEGGDLVVLPMSGNSVGIGNIGLSD